MRVLITALCIAVGGVAISSAQINPNADTYQTDRVTRQMAEQLNDLPANLRRIAIYKINYNHNRFSGEKVAYIKSEIESVFKDHSPLSVVSPPELDPNDKLKVVGSDSTLQIMNIKGRSVADMSPELLESVAQKYSVNGLVELTLQKKTIEGLVVSVRIMNPSSREIVWAKTFEAFAVEEERKEDLGKRVTLNFGVTSLDNESMTLATGPDNPVDVGTKSLLYNVSIGYRQPLNPDNSGYLGFVTGFDIVRSTDSPDFEMSFWEIGLTYDQALSKKSDAINGYRIMMGLDASVWMPQNNRKGDLIVAKPSLIFNLTQNIGFEFNGLVFLSERTVQTGSTAPDSYTFGKLGYGVKAYVQF